MSVHEYDPARGTTYDEAADGPRLAGQLLRTFELMKDGKWRTIKEVSLATGACETSASARLRQLRQDRHGGFIVLRRRVPGCAGLWEYKLDIPKPKPKPVKRIIVLRKKIRKGHK